MKRTKIFLCVVVAGLLLFVSANGQATSLPVRGEHNLKLKTGSGIRTYVAFIPPQAGARPAPLVIALHGYGGSGNNILRQARWREAATRHGFILLAPDGTVEDPDRPPRFVAGNPRSWNAGPASAGSATDRNVDDSGFLRELIKVWVANGRVDANRVYVTGFSNGAAMSFRAGADLSDLVAAIAPVSNGLLSTVDRLKKPVSLLMIWGDADPINKIEGGKVEHGKEEIYRPSAADSFNRWSALLGCHGQPDRSAPQEGILLAQYRNCDGGAQARFYRIAGLGHQWPGGRTMLRAVSGPGSDAIDATEVIWTFFAEHKRG